MVIRKGYKQTELGIIPEDWNYLNMVDVVRKNDSIKIGPFGSQLKKELLVTSGYKVYGQENIFEKNFDIGNRYINVNHFLKLKTCEIVSGDFIISMMGTVGQCMIVPNNIERGIMDSHLIRIRLKLDLISNDFLIYLFQSKIILNQIMKLSVGSIMTGLSSSIIKKLIIPVPTISEQKKIVNTLSEIDELIDSLESLIQKKKNIKQGAMQELLTGKRRLEGFSEEWETTELGKLGLFSKGKGIKKDEILDSGFSCIRYGEIYTKYDTYVIKPISHISKDVARTSHEIKTGDILFSGSGEDEFDIGKCVTYLGNEECYAGGDIIVFTPFKDDSLFLSYLLNSKKIKKQMTSMAQGDMVVHIYSSHLKSICLQIPPTDKEQQIISKILLDMDNEIQQLESQKEKYINLKQAMMQKLLTGEIRLV